MSSVTFVVAASMTVAGVLIEALNCANPCVHGDSSGLRNCDARGVRRGLRKSPDAGAPQGNPNTQRRERIDDLELQPG